MPLCEYLHDVEEMIAVFYKSSGVFTYIAEECENKYAGTLLEQISDYLWMGCLCEGVEKLLCGGFDLSEVIGTF